MTNLSKKTSKLEKKLKVVLGGYTVSDLCIFQLISQQFQNIQHNLQTKLQDCAKQREKLLIELKTFQRLEENEKRAIVKRVDTLMEEVSRFLMNRLILAVCRQTFCWIAVRLVLKWRFDFGIFTRFVLHNTSVFQAHPNLLVYFPRLTQSIFQLRQVQECQAELQKEYAALQQEQSELSTPFKSHQR